MGRLVAKAARVKRMERYCHLRWRSHITLLEPPFPLRWDEISQPRIIPDDVMTKDSAPYPQSPVQSVGADPDPYGDKNQTPFTAECIHG